MSINFNTENSVSYNQFGQAAVSVNKGQKSDLLSQLNQLDQEEQELLKALEKVKKKKEQIQAQLTQLESSEKNKLCESTQTEKVVEKAQKVEEFVKPYLLVDTTKIMQSKDSKGTWEHYSLCLVSKNNEAIAIHQPPIDVKKYGSISQIVVDDGTNKTVLKADEWYHVQRLIHYFSTDFDIFRKGINAETVDLNGCYSNKYVTFDCQRFSYYLMHGKEGTFRKWGKPTPGPDYRNDAKHIAGGTYSIEAQTPNLGRNGMYCGEDISLHHYACLTKDVFVSKFGRNEVVFSSFQQILNAYFPPKFTRGNFFQEYS